MRIEVFCRQCGRVAEETFWSRAVTIAAVHSEDGWDSTHRTKTTGVLSWEAWMRLHDDQRMPSPRRALHRDADGATILIPVEVR